MLQQGWRVAGACAWQNGWKSYAGSEGGLDVFHARRTVTIKVETGPVSFFRLK